MARAASVTRIVRESAPLLAVLVLVQMATGQFLHAESQALYRLPVLLVLIPVVNGVGGNVGSVLGARLASALHMGFVKPSFVGKELYRNVGSALAVAAITYFILSLAIVLLDAGDIVRTGVSPVDVLIILLGSGMILTTLLTILTVITAVLSFRYGWDPDNTVIPVVTTVGDLLGVVSLLVVSAWVFA